MNRFAACLAVALIAAGCASKEKQPDAAVTDRSPVEMLGRTGQVEPVPGKTGVYKVTPNKK